MRTKHSVHGEKHPPLVPLFIVGFVATMLLRDTVDLPEAVLHSASVVQTLLLSSAMFALGLGVHLRKIFSKSKTLLLALAATGTIIAVAASGTLLFPPA